MSQHIRALIFDLDGVITDTVELHYRAWLQLAGETGLPVPEGFRDMLRGVSRRETLKRLLNGRDIDRETAQEWMRRKNMHYLAFIAFLTPAAILPSMANSAGRCRPAGHQDGGRVFEHERPLRATQAGTVRPHGHDRRYHHDPPCQTGAGSVHLGGRSAWRTAARRSSSRTRSTVCRPRAPAASWVVGLGDASLEGAHVRYPDLSEVTLKSILDEIEAREVAQADPRRHHSA